MRGRKGGGRETNRRPLDGGAHCNETREAAGSPVERKGLAGRPSHPRRPRGTPTVGTPPAAAGPPPHRCRGRRHRRQGWRPTSPAPPPPSSFTARTPSGRPLPPAVARCPCRCRRGCRYHCRRCRRRCRRCGCRLPGRGSGRGCVGGGSGRARHPPVQPPRSGWRWAASPPGGELGWGAGGVGRKVNRPRSSRIEPCWGGEEGVGGGRLPSLLARSSLRCRHWARAVGCRRCRRACRQMRRFPIQLLWNREAVVWGYGVAKFTTSTTRTRKRTRIWGVWCRPAPPPRRRRRTAATGTRAAAAVRASLPCGGVPPADWCVP